MCRRDLILTGKCVYLIGREQLKKGPEKGKSIEVVKRKLPFNQISHVSLSTLQVIKHLIILHMHHIYVSRVYEFSCIFSSPHQDNFIIIHTREDYASLLEVVFKTEFLCMLSKKFIEDTGHLMNVRFNNKYVFSRVFSLFAARAIYTFREWDQFIPFQLGVQSEEGRLGWRWDEADKVRTNRLRRQGDPEAVRQSSHRQHRSGITEYEQYVSFAFCLRLIISHRKRGKRVIILKLADVV